MASKKSAVSGSSSVPQPPFITQLIRDYNIPNNIQIRLLTSQEAKKWKTSGLNDENLLVLGRKHIEIIRLPIHHLILQFLSALRLHLMQLIPNSLKFLVASIILNEVEEKNITVEDLIFVFNFKRTPSKPGAPRGQMSTFYLSTSKNYYIFVGSTAVDKDWDSPRNLLVVSGEWVPQGFNHTHFPLVNTFSTGKNTCLCFSEIDF